MPQSELRLIKKWEEHLPKSWVHDLPKGLRGIYVLYKYARRTNSYNVVYVGMSAAGSSGHIKRRLKSHLKNKAGLWSHFSAFQVWDNIRDEEIKELEGLFRQIYKDDSKANKLNIIGGFKKLKKVENIIEEE